MNVHISVLSGPERGRSYSFPRPSRLFLGGATPPDARGAGASLPHLLLAINPPHVFLQDIEARGTTFINDSEHPVNEAQLSHGDRVRDGETLLLIEVRDEDEAGPAAGAPAAAEPAAPGLTGSQPSDSSVGVARVPVRCARCGVRTVGEPPRSVQEHVSYYCPVCQQELLDRPVLPKGYTLIREVGRGGMGAVYLTRHELLRCVRAIKLILPKTAISQRMRQMFVREAAEQARLRHPRVVQVHDMQELLPGCFCMAMEYIAGEDAATLLRRSRGRGIAPALAQAITAQALEGLGYAHRHGVVHRDIKESNLLLERRPGGEVSVKLSDFGLAKCYETAGASKITHTGETGGTPGYVAPEQIVNFREVRPPSDLYSMGAVLYRLLCGRLPHEGQSGASQLLVLLEQPIVPLLERDPAIPPGLAAVAERALQKDPGERFASADEMRQAVLKAL